MAIPKQDRQGVRTPAELERKYNLSEYGDVGISYNKILNALTQLGSSLAQFQANTNSRLSVLEKAILPTKGEIFYTFSDKTLSDVGMTGDTICEVTAIAEGTMQTAGTYSVTFLVLNSNATLSLSVTLSEDILTAINVSDMVYFCENEEQNLCIAYAVKK